VLLTVSCGRKTPASTGGSAVSALAGGRAGETGTPNTGFQPAVAGRPYAFPRDDASHPEFATEWWYYTGHLRDDSGRWYGYQLTFFRIGVSPPGAPRASEWAVRNLYFAHLAITDEARKTYHFRDRISRGALGEAGAKTEAYDVHIGDWRAGLQGKTHVLKAVEDGFGIELRATPRKPPVINGEGGISRKAEGVGRASYYYSYTRMETAGTLYLDGKPVPVTGDSWFDHEYGSNVLAPNQVGWDWFSIQMDNGTEAMLYLMRTTGGGTDPYSSGTFVDATGKATHLTADDYEIEVLDRWKSRESGAEYPSRWHITVPRFGWDVVVTPSVADQEIRASGPAGVTYWEGSALVKGTVRGVGVSGRAYVELTGYTSAFQQQF
jgi:predicted secreted hydrolase